MRRSFSRRRELDRRRVNRAIEHINRQQRRKRPRIRVSESALSDDEDVGEREAREHQGAYGSNLYIKSGEVENFIDRHKDYVIEGEYLDLRRLWRIIQNGVMGIREYAVFWDKERDSDSFVLNEMAKMLRPQARRNWMFPFVSRHALSVPSKDNYDLPVYVMLYIIYRLAQTAETKPSFTVSYAVGDYRNDTIIPAYTEDEGKPISIIDGRISMRDLKYLYETIIRRFMSFFPEGESTWNGSDESGTRIMLRLADMGADPSIYLQIVPFPIPSVNRGHGWTQQVEDMLVETVGNAVISVRNREDNKCLIYCIVMGLLLKIKNGYSRVFGSEKMMVESREVFCKGMYTFKPDTTDPVEQQIRTLSMLLLPPAYSSGEPSELAKFVEDIDQKAGTMISTTEFAKEFSEIEEKLVPKEICGIDVYGIDYNNNRHIYPLYMSKHRDKLIQLLCITPVETRCSHYCLIMNMEKLLRNSGGKQFFTCSKCGGCFYHRRLLNEHHCPVVLQSQGPQRGIVPGGDGDYHYSDKYARSEIDTVVYSCPKCRLSFTDDFTAEYHKIHCFMIGQTGYRHVQLVTYNLDEHPMLRGEEIDLAQEEKHVKRRRLMYADFESSINPETGEHVFMSYGIYDWKSGEYKCGYDITEFIEHILQLAFGDVEDQIFVYFHNAMGYDANFIMREILRNPDYNSWGIQVIMKSMNRLQKLVIHARRNDENRAINIGDTFLFLTLSLEKLVESMRKDDIEENKKAFKHFFAIFKERYPWADEKEIDHILRKNIFPYRFFTDSAKLDTPIEDFLKIFEAKEENLQHFGERVTVEELEENYEDTKHVIETFRCATARDYHDLYLCCDVMQLSDIFNAVMETLWESHKIHLTRYIGMPSATWAAFLRHDPTMEIPLYENTFYAEFFKDMLRGGLTSAALRHAKADKNHSIIYLDVNGLYPYVMQAYKYPCGSLRFVPLGWEGELCPIKLREYFDSFERHGMGMCFCVDLQIPEYLHHMTDMYPFAPEHRRIYKEYFSDVERKEMTPFLKRWSEANEGATMTEFTGLVCTLYPKTKYSTHWRLLKYYMEHGVIVTRVYFGVMFEEGDYMAGYIRKNIELRNKATDELRKKNMKDAGNAVYGKTMESPFKRNTYEIIRDPIRIHGLMSEGNVAAITPIDNLGWIVKMNGDDIVLDKPTYIGACVCEYSKLHMYTLLYDKLMKIFPSVPGENELGCQMVYTDTDSFIVRVRHPPEEHIESDEDLFAYIKRRDPDLIGKIGGQVKSETGEDDTIEEVIALRSKVYAYRTKKGHIGKRAKGTTHDAQEMQLDWETYKRALESLTSITTRNVQFIRKTFKVNTVDVFRQSLSVNDGKRYICKDGIHTHAFGFTLPLSELV